MNEIGQTFIASARAYFAEDYLPKITRCVELLTDEQIWWRANPQSNSIGNLLLHLSGNVRQWIVCSLGGAADERDRDSEFAEHSIIPSDKLLARLKQTLSEAAVLAQFDPDKLLERRTIQGLDVTALEAIFHVVGTLLDACRPISLHYEATDRIRSAFLRLSRGYTAAEFFAVSV